MYEIYRFKQTVMKASISFLPILHYPHLDNIYFISYCATWREEENIIKPFKTDDITDLSSMRKVFPFD